jgi:hypothetical protein
MVKGRISEMTMIDPTCDKHVLNSKEKAGMRSKEGIGWTLTTHSNLLE